MIKIEDFVVLVNATNEIERNSVGIVRMIDKAQHADVFFIGKGVSVYLPLTDLDYLDVNKTGKPHSHKICNVCHILKQDFTDFDINQTDARGNKTTRPSCKSCRVDIDGVALTTEEKKRLDQQKPTLYFVCPICQKASIPDITAKLVRDHDHSTGQAREWLCDSCNTGLGRFKDDVALLQRAIEYLEKHIQRQNN